MTNLENSSETRLKRLVYLIKKYGRDALQDNGRIRDSVVSIGLDTHVKGGILYKFTCEGETKETFVKFDSKEWNMPIEDFLDIESIKHFGMQRIEEIR